jgi:hypothetical protein
MPSVQVVQNLKHYILSTVRLNMVGAIFGAGTDNHLFVTMSHDCLPMFRDLAKLFTGSNNVLIKVPFYRFGFTHEDPMPTMQRNSHFPDPVNLVEGTDYIYDPEVNYKWSEYQVPESDLPAPTPKERTVSFVQQMGDKTVSWTQLGTMVENLK